MRVAAVSIILAMLSSTAMAFSRAAPSLLRSSIRGGANVRLASTLHDFTADTLAGEAKSLGDYKGKVVLALNTASLWGTTVADFTAMNELAEKYGDRLAVLGFLCNQFGHQTNEGDEEFLNTLKYVRPGNGFEPASGVDLFAKVDVNGAEAHPLWKWMRAAIKIPMDGDGDTKGNGVDDVDALILPRGGFGGTTVSLWTPVSRTDVAWNFEKFLLDTDGNVVKRYSRFYPTAKIADDIDALL